MAAIPLYQQFADQLAASIHDGVLRPGERIASVRIASQQHKVSVTTVVRAYELLESRGIIESHPQSGYFVREQAPTGDKPAARRSARQDNPAYQQSTEVDVSRLVLATLKTIQQDGTVPLGSPYPNPALFPSQRVTQYAGRITRSASHSSVFDDLPPGHPDLLRQIARRYLENGLKVNPEEIVVTVGATEAINLCLQAVARPGDTVAVETPTFYAMLHAIERLGMRALEIPTDPRRGIDVDALERIMATQPVAACMVMPNFQNPLGFQMPDGEKERLVRLAERRQMPLIENAVYSELYYGNAHPSSLKNYDRTGLVLHCSSFSKSLTSAYRIGWAMPGRYREQVEKLKFLNTLTTPTVPQRAIAQYLTQGGYERHLRRVRRAFAQQRDLMRHFVLRFFPAGTQVSEPEGGYVLWVELPAGADAMELYRRCLALGITVAPGRIFAATNRYSHFIRLNYSYPWSREIEQALKLVGKLVEELAA
ncbi:MULTISPECIES: PLP-dependent aminotransferase family protein [unclassified Herbaspirillum]|uniref:aminotransferase-like domain-containing protein n=1 Tax=unclassified Herbaspirillum TaxID=2624150 RepID=UPI0011526DDC|nr:MULTISPECIES: PLP-dependent aminotransferase family protein [unclassified Herbaspirillum]MBB5392133.1 DNA-binding transcriptional MocR family regulator [Herbaspirillum sp. SJZ102]TQK13590.1 GntR family transcriptional regulator [Herbaspirillum sp. SJZ130]TQK15593.1 GntR family transcriptional regulator [Herbaspirillum sp. SJZ106]